MKTWIHPKMTFYVLMGDWEPGTLVDREKVGKYIKVDFEDCVIPQAEIVLQCDGEWADKEDNLGNNGVRTTSDSF